MCGAIAVMLENILSAAVATGGLPVESIFDDVAIGPQQVHKVLGRHVLDDGYKLVYDTRASHGSWIVDAR